MAHIMSGGRRFGLFAESGASLLKDVTVTDERTIQLPIQTREAEFEGSNKETRLVHFVFATEFPVARQFGLEILSLTEGACDTSRIVEGVCPLLFNHDFERQLGAVLSCRIGTSAPRKAFGVAKLGTSDLASQTLADMQSGCRPSISVGYLTKSMKLLKAGEDGEQDVYLVTSWSVVEISSCPIPADPQARLSRSLQDNHLYDVRVEGLPTQPVQAYTGTSGVTYTFGNRQPEPEFMPNVQPLTPDIPQTGKSMLTTPVPPLSGLPDPNNSQWKTRVDASKRHQDICRASYSLKSVIEKGSSCDGIERSISNQLSRSLNVDVSGILCPFEVLTRDLSVTVSGAAGGDLVETHLSPSVKDVLRNFSAVTAAGAQVISGLVGNFYWPRFATGSSPVFAVSENVIPTQNTVTFSALNLVPLRIPVQLRISSQLLAQASYDLEALLRETILRDVASAIDGYCLYGTGSNGQILGILNMAQNTTSTSDYSKLSVATTFGGSATWAALTGMETAVFNQNIVPDSSTSWIVSPATRQKLMTTPKISGFPYYLMEDEKIAGYRAFTTNDLSTTNQCVFGNFNNAVICLWALDITSNPFSYAGAGQIQLEITVLANFGLIRGVGLTMSLDSAAQ